MMIDYILEQAQYILNDLNFKTGISNTIPEENIIKGRPD